MAILYMHREFRYMHKGSAYGTDILYVYCDHCGSFSIKRQISLGKWLLFSGGVALTAGVTCAFSIVKSSTWVWLLIFSFGICLLAFKFFGRDIEYKCRKCGNTHITINTPQDSPSEIPKYNLRNYPSTLEVIDVPDQLTQKRYMGYWDDDYQ